MDKTDKTKDIKNILVLLFFFIIALIINWGYWGNIFVDSGREAYLPQLMLEGKLIYKDIFGMYNPLSYQINALFYYIFGANINILAIIGAINSFVILTALYFISRLFINRYYSFIITFFIMLFFVFRMNGCMNFIFPYAYAFTYALSGMILCVLFSLLFIQNENKNCLFLAFLSLGFSFANKPDFLMCLIPLLLLMFLKQRNIKIMFECIILFLLPILISWGILFYQGFTTDDFNNYIVFIQNFFNSEEQKVYHAFIKTSLNGEIISRMLIEFLISTILMLACALSIFLYKKSKIKILGAILFLCLLPLLYKVSEYSSVVFGSVFSWVCIASMVIFLLAIKNKNIKLVFLTMFAVLSCYRLQFILLGGGYSLFYTILPLLTVFIYFIQTPNKFEKIKHYTAVSLLITGVLTFTIHAYSKHLINKPVNMNNKGIMYDFTYKANVFNNTVDWILNNTNENDTVLMLPEGPMINFVTKRPSNPLYYHLIPNHISALGEDNIVLGLNNDKPKYILINNVSYRNYGKEYICRDFGLKICNFIQKNYELVKNEKETSPNGKIFFINIYKLSNES